MNNIKFNAMKCNIIIIITLMIIFNILIFLSKCELIDSRAQTFQVVAVDTDIASPSIHSQIISSVSECAMACNMRFECESFTVCPTDGEGRFLCLLFDGDQLIKNDLADVHLCSLYEKHDFCGNKLKKKLANLLDSLNIAVPALFWTSSKQSKCALIQENQLLQGKNVDVIPLLTKSWIVSVDIKPYGNPKTVYTSVLHFSIGGDMGKHGDRTPAIFFLPNSFRLAITSTLNEISNFQRNLQELEVNVWSTVVVMQHRLQESGEYVYRVYLNNKEVVNVINNNAQEFRNVTVWMSDPWYNVGNANYKNLFYSNLE